MSITSWLVKRCFKVAFWAVAAGPPNKVQEKNAKSNAAECLRARVIVDLLY